MSSPVQSSLTEPTAARASEAGPSEAGPAVVGRDQSFHGLLTFRGRARIEGELRGEVLCRGTLRIGPEGVVLGNIDADELIIGGRLQGDAIARQRIELCGTATVEGAIQAPRVALADGCRLQGRCITAPPPGVDEAADGPAEGS